MKATTELAIRRASRIAAWALIALLGAGCAVALFVSVAEHPVARCVLLACSRLPASPSSSSGPSVTSTERGSRNFAIIQVKMREPSSSSLSQFEKLKKPEEHKETL